MPRYPKLLICLVVGIMGGTVSAAAIAKCGPASVKYWKIELIRVEADDGSGDTVDPTVEEWVPTDAYMNVGGFYAFFIDFWNPEWSIATIGTGR